MKKLRILWRVLQQTRASAILLSYLAFVLADAAFIWLCDPAIEGFGDALWYCCAVISTVGFGDLAASTPVTRIATVLLMAYSVVVIAIVTGVIVNFYSQLISIRQKDTLSSVLNRLERLPELSREELEELSASVKRFSGK